MKHIRNYLATGRTIPKGWHIHHIIPRCEGGSDDASNLICVHSKMHIWVHTMRGDRYGRGGFLAMRDYKHSPETLVKISPLGRKHSEETKAKMSKSSIGNLSNTGRKLPESQRIKMSNAAKNRKNFSCEHCGKSMDPGNIGKYHGDKCKEK